MARGGSRWGSGRPGWHVKAEQVLSLDVRALARRGLLATGFFSWRWRATESGEEVGSVSIWSRDGALALNFRSGGNSVEQLVRLDFTRCHFGGTRTWFRCPHCNRRVALLYFRGARFGCRVCRQVAYSCQSEDLAARTWRRQLKLERQLSEDCGRPKGMHVRTYERLLSAIDRCEERRENALALALSSLGFRW